MTERIDSINSKEAIDKWIVVNQAEFTVTLFKREHDSTELEALKVYRCAVGMPEYPTPVGRFALLRKAKYPDWHPPDRDWVGPDLRDEDGNPITIDGHDERNPIRGAFLDLGNGIGIHGTSNLPSIGTRASHGCIRVTEQEALELYRKTPVGTPVEITSAKPTEAQE